MKIDIYPVHKSFNTLLELYPPVLANKFIPKWYKSQKLTHIDNNKEISNAKRCPAIQDYMFDGFVIPAWSDITLIKTNNGIQWVVSVGNSFALPQDYTWISGQSEKQITGMNINALDNYGVLKLNSPYYFRTEKGYGLEFQDLFYQFRKDIKFLPARVRTDIWNEVNFPFEFYENIEKKDNFKIEIKAGDPLIMVKPYKIDESFKLNINNFDDKINKEIEKQNILNSSLSMSWNKYIKALKLR